MTSISHRTRAYLQYCRFLRRYHRVSVEGLEHLLTPGAKLVVGYHGRGFPMDLGILGLELFERRGYLPHSIVHSGLWKIPILRHFVDHWGAIPGEVPKLRDAVERGECIFVAPGGTYEGLRSFRERYRVDWGRRRGYLKLALKLGIPIVPVASSGVDDRFIGLNNGHTWGKRLHIPYEIPVWIAAGVGGVFPFALPIPSRIHTVIGQPISLNDIASDSFESSETLDHLHQMVTGRVQTLLDSALSHTRTHR